MKFIPVPCALTLKQKSAASLWHHPQRSFWGTPSHSATSRCWPQKGRCCLFCCLPRALTQQQRHLELHNARRIELYLAGSPSCSTASTGHCPERIPQARYIELEAGRVASTAWEFHSSACSCLWVERLVHMCWRTAAKPPCGSSRLSSVQWGTDCTKKIAVEHTKHLHQLYYSSSCNIKK